MMKPVHSRQLEANPRSGTTMSILISLVINLEFPPTLPGNRWNSMKRATQSAMGSRMKECQVLAGQNGWGEHKGVLAHEALQSSYLVGRVRTKALGFVEPCCLRGGFVTIAVESKPVSS